MTKLERALLLTIMHHEPDAYGVPIRREVSQRLGYQVSFGTLYNALDLLEQKGLVASLPKAATEDYEKRLYYVEPAGQRALIEHTRVALSKTPTKTLLVRVMSSERLTRLLLLVAFSLLALIALALAQRVMAAEQDQKNFTTPENTPSYFVNEQAPQRPYSCRLLDDEQRKCAFGACDHQVIERLTKECWRDGGRP